MTINREKERLKDITFVFPNRQLSEMRWNATFCDLLMGIPNCHDLIFPSIPQKTLPRTGFRSYDVSSPSIVLNTNAQIQTTIGRISIRNEVDSTKVGLIKETDDTGIDLDASLNPKALTVKEVHSRLKGRIVNIDHTGINIPETLLEKTKWDALIREISQITNLYRYPEEEWPFIIPANEEEFQDDITEFLDIRTPKFELVYDRYSSIPIFQYALVTDYSRQEVEEMFPAPQGFSIPGLGDIFRSVRIDSPWREYLAIRFDLYYKRLPGDPSDWETGEWLIKQGGRII